MPTNPDEIAHWPPEDSEMAQRVRNFDWSNSPLGPVSGWNIELKFALGSLFDNAFPTALVWGSNLTTFFNDAFLPILSAGTDALGRPFADIWSEAWQDIGPLAERAMSGHSAFLEDYPLRLERSGKSELAFFTFSCSPVRGAEGLVLGFMHVAIETTEKVRAATALSGAERRQNLLMEELRHRVRNTLGVIRAIARRSAQTSTSIGELAMHLDGRIAAFARVQGATMRDPLAGLDLESLVAEAMLAVSAKEGDQYSISGPPILLTPKAAEVIGLALHELITNAVKYGALLVSQGRIRVSWALQHQPQDVPILHIDWIETGVNLPRVQPSRRGFGTELLTRTLSYELDAQVERRYDESGMRYSFRIPANDRVIKRS